MRLGIVTLGLPVIFSRANEVVNAHYLDLCGMSLACAGTILTNATALKASVVELLLSLQLLL